MCESDTGWAWAAAATIRALRAGAFLVDWREYGGARAEADGRIRAGREIEESYGDGAGAGNWAGVLAVHALVAPWLKLAGVNYSGREK